MESRLFMHDSKDLPVSTELAKHLPCRQCIGIAKRSLSCKVAFIDVSHKHPTYNIILAKLRNLIFKMVSPSRPSKRKLDHNTPISPPPLRRKVQSTTTRTYTSKSRSLPHQPLHRNCSGIVLYSHVTEAPREGGVARTSTKR
jgi:hypothetical protein